MLELSKERGEVSVVDDGILTPTYTVDIANQIVEIIKTDHYGLFHATAQGNCSWYAFAPRIFELTGTHVKLSIANPNEFQTKALSPKYFVLVKNKRFELFKIDLMTH
jgi:dTDP-4-dehydrorhamnose reductase